jgi:hypothetical protein
MIMCITAGLQKADHTSVLRPWRPHLVDVVRGLVEAVHEGPVERVDLRVEDDTPQVVSGAGYRGPTVQAADVGRSGG